MAIQIHGMPAMKNMVPQISANSTVCPKSGCVTKRPAQMPNKMIENRLQGMSGRLVLSANRNAVVTTNTGFRNSEGCNRKDPTANQRVAPFAEKHSEEKIKAFLDICFYQGGKSYGDIDAFGNLKTTMETFEKENSTMKEANRLFYFAIPPNVFGETAVAIKKTSMQEESKYKSQRD